MYFKAAKLYSSSYLQKIGTVKMQCHIRAIHIVDCKYILNMIMEIALGTERRNLQFI